MEYSVSSSPTSKMIMNENNGNLKQHRLKHDEKKAFILSELNQKGSVRVSELSEQLGLSSVSIRNMLMSLEKEYLLQRTWGGAIKPIGTAKEMSYQTRETKYLREKAAIAQTAYDYIEEGNTIYIDSGTTTFELVKLLRNKPKQNILIATNAFDHATELIGIPDLRIIFAGGEIRHDSRATSGYITTDTIRKMIFDKVFIGIEHISYEHGITTPNIQEADLKQTILNSAKQCFVLADYSKFWDDSLIQVNVPQKLYQVITDWHITKEEIRRFNAKGIHCIVAPDLSGE